MTWKITSIFACCLLLCLLPGCGQAEEFTPAASPAETAPPQASPTAARTQTPRILPAVTFTPSAPAAAPAPTEAEALSVCSPLEDIEIEELSQPDLMKNPFELPRPGIDDGHPGVDFAYWSRGEHKQMLGLGVRAVLAGRVAGLIQNRQPYGYAILIETPLDRLPEAWVRAMQLQTPAPTVQPAPNLICPPASSTEAPPAGRSLYLLYAHLNRPPEAVLGQEAACGQRIGEVGTTGRSVNPHLHLEVRAGPAGASFTEMAHYDNSATENEMRNYCIWRVSGLFQPLDPLAVIQALSLQP